MPSVGRILLALWLACAARPLCAQVAGLPIAIDRGSNRAAAVDGVALEGDALDDRSVGGAANERATSPAGSVSPYDGAARAAGHALPLKLPRRAAPPSRADAPPEPVSATRSIGTVLGSLALVLGLFVAVVWLARRNLPQAARPLPAEVIEVLGRAPLAARQQMHLVRVGQKLILLSVTPTGAETLTEITDPAEVERLASLALAQHPRSSTASFREALVQLGKEPAPGGFWGRLTDPSPAAAAAAPTPAVSGAPERRRTPEQRHA